MKTNKILEVTSYFLVSWGVVILGTAIGAACLTFLAGSLAVATIGNPLHELFTNDQMVILYGLTSLFLLHVCTAGWWVIGCAKHIETMKVEHIQAMARFN